MNIDLIIVFQSCINLLCSCNLEIESTTLFLLQCHHFSNIRLNILKYSLNSLKKFNEVLGSITNLSHCTLY